MDFLEKESKEIINKHINLAVKASTSRIANIQLDMLKELCYCYQVSFPKDIGEEIIETLTEAKNKGSKTSFLSSKLESFMRDDDAKFSTYALAKVFVNHLETGRHLIELDFDAAQKLYNEAFEEAKLPKKARPKIVEKAEEKPLKIKTFPAPDSEISIEYISSKTKEAVKDAEEIIVSDNDISIDVVEKATEEIIENTSEVPVLDNDISIDIAEKVTEEVIEGTSEMPILENDISIDIAKKATKEVIEDTSEVPPPISSILDSELKLETEFNESENSVFKTDAGDIFETLKKLGKLRDLGILTEEEFMSKKKELLARI
ncbi:MAG: hypothetical protein ACPG5B_14920 [Chitinophagales bacterium]